MEENRVLTIPKEQYDLIDNRPELFFKCPNYYVHKVSRNEHTVKLSDNDLELTYTLFDLSNHEVISRQLISLIPKISYKAIDELIEDIDKLMKNEVEIINIVENTWKDCVLDIFAGTAKNMPEHVQTKYIDEFRNTMKVPIRENIQSLYEKIKNESKILEYIVEFRFRKYGNRGRTTKNETIEEMNKKILRKIQNQVYYQKNKNIARMTPQEIEEHMKFLKTKTSAWRLKEIKCECGSKFIQANRARHEKTSIVHLRYLQKKAEEDNELNYDDNIEDENEA